MEFGLSLEQRQFDDSLRAFLDDHLPMERLRMLAESGTGYDERLWRDLAELGLHGLLVPERFGGRRARRAGCGGRGRGAWICRRAGAVRRQRRDGDSGVHEQRQEALQDEYLPRIAAGEGRFAVALPSLAGQTGTGSVELTNGRLFGPRHRRRGRWRGHAFSHLPAGRPRRGGQRPMRRESSLICNEVSIAPALLPM